MKPNNYLISSPWDLAFHLGHTSLELFGTGTDFEKQELELNAQLLPTLTDENRRFSLNYLNLLHNRDTASASMLRFYSLSVVGFQIMMEALINSFLEELASQDLHLILKPFKLTTRDGGIKTISDWKQFSELSFFDKWMHTLNAADKDTNAFSEYHSTIYKKLRNTFTHPKKGDLKNLDLLNNNYLFDGFQNGWESYRLLSEGIGRPHTKDSWKTMCEINGVTRL